MKAKKTKAQCLIIFPRENKVGFRANLNSLKSYMLQWRSQKLMMNLKCQSHRQMKLSRLRSLKRYLLILETLQSRSKIWKLRIAHKDRTSIWCLLTWAARWRTAMKAVNSNSTNSKLWAQTKKKIKKKTKTKNQLNLFK